MPNIARVFREEIARISRKEAKSAVSPVRKPVLKLRTSVADLKKRFAALEADNRRLQDLLKKVETAIPSTPAPEESERVRLTARGIKSLRRRLRMSQDDFAELAGVSDQAVYLWENRQGGLKLRKKTKAAILAVRNITATEARKRLEELKKAKKPVSKPKAQIERRRK